MAVLVSSFAVLVAALWTTMGDRFSSGDSGSRLVAEWLLGAPLIPTWLLTSMWMARVQEGQRLRDPSLPPLGRRWFLVAWALPLFMFYGPASSLTALDRSIYRRPRAHRRIYAWAISFVLVGPILLGRRGSSQSPDFPIDPGVWAWVAALTVCVAWALWAWTVLTISAGSAGRSTAAVTEDNLADRGVLL